MHGIDPIDPGKIINWSNTSTDYATYRPGPPPRFYAMLHALGVGLPEQRILDLGTGTGVLARQFASQGAQVSGVDVAEGQIEMAQKLAEEEGVTVDFRVSGAESTPFADSRFDAITANQCWLYFDKAQAIPEVQRLLAEGRRAYYIALLLAGPARPRGARLGAACAPAQPGVVGERLARQHP